MRKTILFQLHTFQITALLFLALFSNMVQAVVAPYYTYGEVNTEIRQPSYSVIEYTNAQGVASQTVEGGNQWWCDTPNCGVSISPGAQGAYGVVSTDPATGTLGASAGSMAYNNYGGYGEAYGYISQVFRVGSDGSLSPGDLVNLDVGMILEGTIESGSWSGQAAGLVTVNYYDPAQQYVDGFGNPLDYMPLGTFQDLLFTPELLDQMLGTVQSYNTQNTSTVNFSGSDTFDVQVGDLLIMESMIFVNNQLGYSDGLNYSWTDFSSTMGSSLAANTAGATISAVPLPPALYLFVSGIALMLMRRRKQS